MIVARWICRTPLRLVLTALAVIAAAAGVLVTTFTHAPPPDIRPAVAATVAPLDPAVATRVGQEFVALWCQLGDWTPEQWVTQMQARTTPEFGRYWTTATAGNLTDDCPWGYAKPRLTEPQRVRVLVMTKGNPVLVDVVQGAHGPLVAGVAPDDEGDL